MKCYNDTDSYEMSEELQDKLHTLRERRGFDVDSYIDKKVQTLNQYMGDAGLDSCIIAISGGIDSAVVLGLVYKASQVEGSPIKGVYPVLLPCYNNDGVTNQVSATARGKELCNKFDLKPTTINMKDIVSVVRCCVEDETDLEPDNWGVGQLVPYCRTPVLYYVATLLNVHGHKGIICGTTNFSEGGYLGYVGKASDGMVDIQLISDIYKSEVYQVAEKLGIPSSIIKAVPSGDMYDKRSDIEVFGAPYDFVELYQEILRLNETERKDFVSSIKDKYARSQYLSWMYNIENLHKYNSHKYLAGSPAVHLDLWDSNVPNGWHNTRWGCSHE